MTSVLLIDDQTAICRSLSQNFEIREMYCYIAHDQSDALTQLEKHKVDIILLDLALGEESGLDVLEELQKRHSDIPVIMITGHGSIHSAVLAMKKGAQDFVQKPITFESLLLRIEQCLEMKSLKVENQDLQQCISEALPIIHTCNEQVQDLLQKAEQLASTNIPVMIQGESGTGKEHMAKFIHHKSPRQHKPFRQINCAALSEQLLDGELFGHEKGAFTGANAMRQGLFESANHGTLHMDEIGDMSLSTQTKVLRVLQNKEIRRLGSNVNLPIDIRIVASTNKNLEDMVQKGEFREDLYYRLKVASIVMPPLRSRIDDLEILCPEILKNFAYEHNRRICELSSEAMQCLKQHPWPGNIRELKNVLQVAATLCRDDLITDSDLLSTLHHTKSTQTSSKWRDQEKDIIEKALQEAQGNKSLAAEKLSISRKTLYNKIAKYGL